MSIDILHLYSQAYQHQVAWVVGTREGLTALRDALNEALAIDGPAAITSYTADGEGYKAIVWPLPEAKAQDLRPPYVDPAGAQVGTHPFMLMDRDTYRRLAR